MVKKIKRTKRKLKKKIKLFLYLTFITITIISLATYYFINSQAKETHNPKVPTRTSKDIISSILTYQLEEGIDQNFLEWINQNYSKQTLEELEIYLASNPYQQSIWHKLTSNSLIVLKDQYNNVTSNRIKELVPKQKNNEVIISFVGDVSLADDWYIMPEYDKRGKNIYGILSEEVVNIMNSSDIMVANNEFTISNRGSKMPKKYYTFRGAPERLSIYGEMGVNLVTLANNHIYDYGETAFYDALNALEEYNIPYIGAGRNIEEAKEPFYYIINGYKIGFVNATRAEKYILTPEATQTTGGVLRCYNPEIFLNVIEETKKQSDFVIALIHWGKEDSSQLEQVQLDTAPKYIEAGADLIIGTHAHTLQGIDFYNNKAIAYNIGDFIFNHETKDTGIFQLKIDNDGNFKYYFLPCKQKDKYTYLLTEQEQVRVLNKMRQLSPNITINEDGEIIQNNTN